MSYEERGAIVGERTERATLLAGALLAATAVLVVRGR